MTSSKSYSDCVKRNLVAVKMIAQGLKTSTMAITDDRIEMMRKKQLSVSGNRLETINVPLHEIDSIAKLTFFQNRKINGEYEMSVFIAPNISYLSIQHTRMLSLCNDVKKNLLSIKELIEHLYSEYKIASAK